MPFLIWCYPFLCYCVSTLILIGLVVWIGFGLNSHSIQTLNISAVWFGLNYFHFTNRSNPNQFILIWIGLNDSVYKGKKIVTKKKKKLFTNKYHLHSTSTSI